MIDVISLQPMFTVMCFALVDIANDPRLGTNFYRPMRLLDTNQWNNIDLRMLVKTDSGEEGCHE